jgi:predicted metal-dependent enzyme (double-stranded beta helix superfamily)
MSHTTIPEPLETDQWFVDSPELSEFVATAKEIIASTSGDRAETLNALKPYFTALLNKQNWLPQNFARPNPDGGLGGGIGQWLLYRSQEPCLTTSPNSWRGFSCGRRFANANTNASTLTIFSLVIPPNSITPVHDHLSWGLVGLYQGKQEETVYRRLDKGETEGFADLEIVGLHQVNRGEIYHLLPPDGDIHSVKATTVFSPSISIHVMGNDTGSIWRNQYHPEQQSIKSFRSGYSNVP